MANGEPQTRVPIAHGATAHGDRRDAAASARAHQELVRLSRRVATHVDNLPQALAEITETASRLLDAERVNIWHYRDEDRMLHCLEGWSRSTGRHECGEELTAARYPAYFHALEENRFLAADHVRSDPRTQELVEGYLEPHGIYSMLDAPIRVGGAVIGVICHERTGSERPWSAEDQVLAASLGDLTALAMDMHERRRAEAALAASVRENAALIDELRHANERLAGANDRLQELDRLKSEFLALVSHELRTPVAAMHGAVENLLAGVDGPVTDRQRRVLEIMARNRARLGRLIDNLLDLSQIEAGRFLPLRAVHDLREPVSFAVDAMQSLAAERGLTLRAVLPSQPLTAHVDADRIVQVLTNLLDNAIRHATSRVTVQLTADGGQAQLEVSDDGAGIDAKMAASLAQTFVRAGRASDVGGHVGLGLAIVHALVRAHDGTVRAERLAAPDHGTRVVVVLPRAGRGAGV